MRRRYILAAVVAVVLILAYRRRHRAPFWRRWLGSKSGFKAVPLLPCGPAAPPEYAVDQTGRGAGGTVVWGPYCPGIHRGIATNGSAEHFAGRPSNLQPSASGVSRYSTRVEEGYTPHPVPSLPSHKHLAHHAPVDADAADPNEGGPAVSGLASLTRRSAAPASRACSRVFSDVDSDVSLEGWGSDETSTKGSARAQPGKVAVVAMCERAAPYAPPELNPASSLARHTPASLRIGLGSVVLDPRFQPGDPRWLASDGQPAAGTYSGGESMGALVPSAFGRTGAWDATRTRGFGGGQGMSGQSGDDPVRGYEAVVTNMS